MDASISTPSPFGLCGKAVPTGMRNDGLLARLRRSLSRSGDAATHKQTVLTYVQPALAGLMDGSVSTLAPLFAVAFATHDAHKALLVGLAAALGAGVSMGFAEGLSDDGALSGRGSPRVRGLVCGLATALGGLGHTLPYLLPGFTTATLVAGLVVALELALIAWIRARFMDTPLSKAIIQIVAGGAIVLAVGIAIGSA